MNRYRKLLAAACGMLLCLTGCGGTSEPESSAAQTQETTAQTQVTTEKQKETAVQTDTTWVMADESLGLPALGLGMTTPEMCRRAVISQGNRARLANVMKKAQNKEAVTVSCIGGSITQGTGAESNQKNYAYLSMAWWVKTFPEASAKLNYVNAGIGATGSYIGVHRAERDLLSQKPDVVIVEFSVNDTNPVRDLQSYDSLIRRILEQDNQPAVILLFMTQDNGTSLAETHQRVGAAYDLPMISYKNAVMPEIQAGTFTWGDISPDNIHPNTNGHGIAAELLWNYYNSVYAALDSIDTTDLSFTAPPVSEDRYQNPQLLSAAELTPAECEGFAEAEVSQSFPHNYRTEEAGRISFAVTAQNIGVLFQRTVDGKSGKYEVYVDGEKKGILDGDFPGGWGNYAEAQEVFVSEDAAPHTVTLQPAEGNKAEGFVLLGLLVS